MKTTRFLVLLLTIPFAMPITAAECVVLLHGLARTAGSMTVLESALSDAGYLVVNVDYPSRHKTVEELAEIAVGEGLARCEKAGAGSINFVTHSLGGILVRQYFDQHEHPGLDRVVMLGPPNHGSEVVDKLKNVPGFELFNGPAGMQLGTGQFDIPNSLGPVNFDLGVIAGSQSINLMLSTLLPASDDGKVTIESTRIDGMCGFVVLPVTHSFMMRNDQVIGEVMHFLEHGEFGSESAIHSC